MKHLLVLGLAAVLLVNPVTAQETTSECDLQAVNEAMAIASDTIITGDQDASLAALSDLKNLISATQAECAELAFDSETEGQSPVIGPLTFEAGTWVSTVETDGYFIAQVTVLDGECDTGFMSLYNLSEGQGIGGAQKVIRSEGYTMLIEISNTREPWTLTFEKVA